LATAPSRRRWCTCADLEAVCLVAAGVVRADPTAADAVSTLRIAIKAR